MTYELGSCPDLQYFLRPCTQREDAQHCMAAIAYCALESHYKVTYSPNRDGSRGSLRHNALAISILQKEVASGSKADDDPAMVISIFLLGFLAVGSQRT
jgi:hypothetical protein